MTDTDTKTHKVDSDVTPQCSVFGECGGCLYQDISYEKELNIKKSQIQNMASELGLDKALVEDVIPSPKPYHYRNRIDLNLFRNKLGEIKIGFMPQGKFRVLPVKECAIAEEVVSDFIPTLYKEVEEKISEKYRIANLVVRTGEEEKIFWGGMGKKSLSMKEEDYFWIDIDQKRIFYALDTFFQANRYILPLLKKKMEDEVLFDKEETLFLDLYSGVGLFGILFSDKVKEVTMIEDVKASVKVANYNIKHNNLENINLYQGRVDDYLNDALKNKTNTDCVAIIDPPRKGLSKSVAETLSQSKFIRSLVYLSCSPESLFRDLKYFIDSNWRVKSICPLDFFPKTKHIETLVFLEPRNE